MEHSYAIVEDTKYIYLYRIEPGNKRIKLAVMDIEGSTSTLRKLKDLLESVKIPLSELHEAEDIQKGAKHTYKARWTSVLVSRGKELHTD